MVVSDTITLFSCSPSQQRRFELFFSLFSGTIQRWKWQTHSYRWSIDNYVSVCKWHWDYVKWPFKRVETSISYPILNRIQKMKSNWPMSVTPPGIQIAPYNLIITSKNSHRTISSIWISELVIIISNLTSANIIEKHQLWKKNKLECRRLLY